MHIHTANSYSDLGICFTSTPMAPLFFLFREFINGMEMSLLVSLSHFIKRIKSYFSRGEGGKKKRRKKEKKIFATYGCEYRARDSKLRNDCKIGRKRERGEGKKYVSKYQVSSSLYGNFKDNGERNLINEKKEKKEKKKKKRNVLTRFISMENFLFDFHNFRYSSLSFGRNNENCAIRIR